MNYQPEAPTLAELKFKTLRHAGCPTWCSGCSFSYRRSKYVMAMSLEALGGDGLSGRIAQAAPTAGERV